MSSLNKNYNGLESQLLKIGQAIQEQITTTPQAVYQLIAEAVCQSTGADCAVIYPYDPSFGEFYDTSNVAACGLNHKLPVEKDADKKRRLKSRVHQKGEFICEDTHTTEAKDAVRSNFVEREGIRAFMGLSLRIDKNILGILYVDYRAPHHFTEEEKQRVRLFGQQAASAVFNSWSFRLARIRGKTVSQLKKVGYSLIDVGEPSTNLDELLLQITQSAKDVLDADIVDLYRYNQQHDQFILPPIFVGDRRYPALVPQIIHQDDVVVKVLRAGKSAYFGEAQSEPLLVGEFEPHERASSQRFVIREEIDSVAIILLSAVNETVGVMFINYRAPQLFSLEQRDVIETLAAQAAIAIRNARLFQLEQAQRQFSDTLRDVARHVNTLDLEEVVDSVLDHLKKVIDYSSASVQHIQGGEYRTLLGGKGFRQKKSVPQLLRKVSEDPLVKWIVQEQRPLVISDVNQEPRWEEFEETAHVQSWLGVPLRVKQEVIGLLTIDHERAGFYTDDDGNTVAIFADQVALAINNADLFSREQRHNKDLNTLNEAALGLSEIRDKDKIYHAIVDAVVDTLACDYCTVFLVQANKLVTHISGGREFKRAPKLQFAPGEGLAGWAYQENDAFIVNNTAEDPRYISGPLDKKGIKPRSIMVCPILQEENVMGVVSADKHNPYAFTENDLRLLKTLTLHAGTALQNIEFLEDFKILHRVANELPSQSSQEQIYQIAVESALQTLHCSHSTIFILNENSGALVARARVGTTQSASDVRPFKPGEGLAGVVLKEGRSLKIDDAAGDERFIEGKVKPRSVPRSVILAPIKIKDDVVGVISADKDEIGGFTEHNLRVLEMLALDVGVALNVRQQLQQLSDQAQALGELSELSSQLISIKESPQETEILLVQIAASAQKVLRADLIELYEYWPERNEYRLPQISVGERRGPEVLKEKIHEDDAVFKLIQRQSPLYVAQAQGDAVLSGPYSVEREGRPEDRFVVREGIQSSAAIPLRTGGRPVGLMFASYRAPQAFNAKQKEIIELFAGQAAIALQNARLYRQSEDRAEALDALNEVGRTLTSGIRLQENEILELIYKQTVELTGTKDMYIALYDDKTEMIRFPLMLEGGERISFEERQADMKKRGTTEEILFTQKPILLKTKQEAEAWYASPEHKERYGKMPLSWLGVPMIVGEKVLGVIALWDFEREYAYDEDDRQTLLSLSSQAAIALDNATLYYEVNQALERRIEALDALYEVGNILTSGIRSTEDEILELIYQQTVRLTKTQDMYIALYDEEMGIIRFPFMLELGKRIILAARKANKKKWGKTEEIIFNKQPLWHQTQQVSIDWYSLPEHQDFTGHIPLSWLGVPMMVGKKLLGVIAIWDFEQEFAYDEYDRQTLMSMAGQAAIALDLQRRVEHIQTVQAITNAIKTYADLPDLLRSILDVSLPHLHAKVGTIQLLEEETDELVMQAAVGEIKEEEYHRISLEQGITGEAARSGEAIYVPDTEHDDRFIKYLGQMHSELAIPLKSGEDIIGVFNIEDPQPNAFDEATRELAQLIADQSAIVIQNVRRREELIANRQLAALGTATAAIQHRINNTFNIIVPNVARLRRRVDASDPVIEEVLDIIDRNAHYTSTYIQRIQEPLKETDVQMVDINLSLREASADIQAQYQDRAGFGPVNIEHKLEEPLPLIEASLSQITETFRNLIENSYKAMGAEGGSLTIISRRVDDELEVKIQDTGPGIPDKVRNKLFNKPVPSQQPSEGSGLGLWLAKLLLQQYAGEIEIAKTGPEGTTMLVRLPVKEPA